MERDDAAYLDKWKREVFTLQMRGRTSTGKAKLKTSSRSSVSRPSSERLMTGAVCIFLAVIVWIVFGQTLGYDFVNYDDSEYVYQNPKVTAGLTLSVEK